MNKNKSGCDTVRNTHTHTKAVWTDNINFSTEFRAESKLPYRHHHLFFILFCLFSFRPGFHLESWRRLAGRLICCERPTNSKNKISFVKKKNRGSFCGQEEKNHMKWQTSGLAHTTETSRETNGRHTKVLSVVIGQRLLFNYFFSRLKGDARMCCLPKLVGGIFLSPQANAHTHTTRERERVVDMLWFCCSAGPLCVFVPFCFLT